MKRFLIPLMLLLGSPLVAQKVMTPELLLRVKGVSYNELSGDGKIVYYSTREADVPNDKNKYKNYQVEVATGNRKELVASNEMNIFERRSDVWFALNSTSIYSSRNNGRTWEMFYSLPEGAGNIRISPNKQYIVFSKEVLVTHMLGTDKYPDLQKTSARIYTDLNYRHWDTWEDGNYSHLFLARLNGGSVIDIMDKEPFDCPQKPFGGSEDIVWSPDSKGFVYVCKKKAGKEYAKSTNTDLYYYDIGLGKTHNMTINMMGYDQAPAFSPDGRQIAWLSMRRDGYEADKNDIMVMDLRSRSLVDRINLTEKWDGEVSSFIWSNDSKSIYFSAPWRGTKQAFSVSVPPVFDGNADIFVTQISNGNFDIHTINAQSGNKLIVSRCDFNHASELFSLDIANGDMQALTYENAGIYRTIDLSETKLRIVKTSDNKKMGVWVIYPPNFDPKKKYPVILYCQGGPQSALSQFYSTRWNFQLMAAKGYIVVAPNRRGMPGWGTAWNEAISKDWGGGAMKDYLAAIDDVSSESYVDRNRIACVGASYGGYSVFMLAGMHEKRFKTFISHCGLFDLKSWYGTTEELWFANWDVGGPYWNKPQPASYEKFNPSNFVNNWTAPMMIIQGGKDYRVPIEQGLEAFQAAQLKGLKSKLLYLPDENHWVLKSQNALVWQREFFSWLEETMPAKK